MSINIDNNVKNQGSAPAMAEGLFANRPSAGQPGRLYLSTDTNVIYLDNGSSWVSFLSQASVPGGLTPIGTAYQYLEVNSAGTALQYATLGGSLPITVTNTGTITSISMSVANNAQDGYLTSTNFNTFNAKIGGSGTANTIAKFSASGTIGNSSLTDSGTIITTTSDLRIGTTPGTTYKLEVDGGINVATGHNYRKNGVVIFNTTNNTLPKYDATTGTYTNSNITDSGLVVQWNVQTGIGPLSSAGVSLDVNSAISFTTNYVGIKSATIIASTATSVSYFQSVGSNTTGGTITNLNHYSATQGTYGVAVTNQYGFIANSTLIGATKNYGFYSDLALSGTARYNFYANGTAPNYFAGTTNFGITGGTLISSQVAIYNSLNIQNNDFAGGSTGSYATFALSATSGNGLILDIESKSSGGTQSSVIRFNKQGTGNVIIGTIASPAYTLQLQTDSAGKPSTSTWTIVSDARVKTKVKSYDKGLSEVLAINCIEYMYNGLGGFDKTKGGIGILAQEIKDIVPECVDTYMGQLNPDDSELTEMYNFNSHALTFILINAIKELNSKIENLQKN